MPLKGVVLSPDAALYLNKGLRLYTDFNYENLMTRRPLLPVLISLSFHIFGRSIESAVWVIRLFFVLNIVLCYFVGSKLFSRSVGIGFSLFVLTSFTINRWSSLLLVDALIPFFIFLYVLCLYMAFERRRSFFFLIAGGVMGLAFLVKGVFSVFYLFLPLCLLVGVKSYRSTVQLRHILFLYGGVLFVISPWLWHCFMENDFSVLIGPLADASKIKASGVVPVKSGEAGSVWIMLVDQLKNFKVFFKAYISDVFILSPLFVLGAGYVIYHAFFVRKQTAHAYLVCALFLFSPIVYVGMTSGSSGFRHGQFMVLYFLLYLMTAILLKRLSSAGTVFFKGPKNEKLKDYIIVGLIGLCVFFQVFIGSEPDRTVYALMKKEKVHRVYGFSFWNGEFHENGGWVNPVTREGSDWISNHIPKGEPILCQWYYLRMLDYFTDNKYGFKKIKYRLFHEDMGGKPLFLWPRYNPETMAGNSLAGLYEEDFLSQVNGEQIRFIVVTHRRNFLTMYLRAHPGFEQIHSITRENKNIKIFKTSNFPVEPNTQFNVRFHENLVPYFQAAGKNDAIVFENRKRELKQILNWDDTRLNVLISLVMQPDITNFKQSYKTVKSRMIY